MARIKACLFDTLFAEGLERQLYGELIVPIRERGYNLDHRSIKYLERYYAQYDAIMIHTHGISDEIIRLVKIDSEKPILIVAGTSVIFSYFRKLIGNALNVSYERISIDALVDFIERAKAKELNRQ